MRYLLCLSMMLVSAAAAHAAERRELAAHEHGHGTLNIALDGQVLALELTAPGADIVGFEHEARSAADKNKVAQAKATLSRAERVVSLEPAAECSLAEAAIDTDHDKAAKPGGHDHDGHDAHATNETHEDHGGHKAHGADGDGGAHSEFRVTYSFKCANADAITTVTLPYFATFPNAEELEVTIITPKGQLKHEATRAAPAARFPDAP